MSQEKTYIHNMTDEDLFKAFKRAKEVKKGEFFVARTLSPNSEHLKNDKAFLSFLEETFEQLLKFYK